MCTLHWTAILITFWLILGNWPLILNIFWLRAVATTTKGLKPGIRRPEAPLQPWWVCNPEEILSPGLPCCLLGPPLLKDGFLHSPAGAASWLGLSWTLRTPLRGTSAWFLSISGAWSVKFIWHSLWLCSLFLLTLGVPIGKVDVIAEMPPPPQDCKKTKQA